MRLPGALRARLDRGHQTGGTRTDDRQIDRFSHGQLAARVSYTTGSGGLTCRAAPVSNVRCGGPTPFAFTAAYGPGVLRPKENLQ